MRTRRHHGIRSEDIARTSVQAGPGITSRAADRPFASLDASSLARADTGTRVDTALALQRSAGNAAVTTIVRPGDTARMGLGSGAGPTSNQAAGERRTRRGHVAAFETKDPPKGLADIRKAHGASVVAHTQGKINGTPPLFKVDGGDDGKGGRTAKVRRARTRPPDHDVVLPGLGRHDVGAYGKFRHVIVIEQDWADRIKVGEQEHVDDETLAWQLTWKVIADAINAVADGQPVGGKTDEAATRSAWSKVLAKLPTYLHPKDASESAQTERWDYLKGSPVKWLIDTSKRVRDVEGQWHYPTWDPEDANPKRDMVDRPVNGQTTKIPGKLPADLMDEATKQALKLFPKP